MTLLPQGVKVHLAFGFINMRKGIHGLAMLVQRAAAAGSLLGSDGGGSMLRPFAERTPPLVLNRF